MTRGRCIRLGDRRAIDWGPVADLWSDRGRMDKMGTSKVEAKSAIQALGN